MVEQPEILEHDADPSPQAGDVVLGERGGVLAEQLDEAARRLQRQEDQAQQRGLAGAGRPGEELEGLRLDREGDVAQDLGTHAVPQADILESDHSGAPAAGAA